MRLRFKLGCDGDFRLEEFGNGTARFRVLDRCVKFGFVRARNFGDKVEMAFGDGEAVSDFFKRNSSSSFEFFRNHAESTQLGGKRHGESTRVCGSEQLFWIRANAVF